MQNKSLSNIKVLDLSRYIAGPFCGQVFGDLGADVVKVERADGGEEGRRVGEMVDGETLFFMGANRNKRSLTLDFRNPDGQALLRRLAAKADILIENFRPGTLEKMGKLSLPVLFIHALADEIVPRGEERRVFGHDRGRRFRFGVPAGMLRQKQRGQLKGN